MRRLPIALAVLIPCTLLLIAADLPVRYDESTGQVTTAITLDSVTDLTVTDTASIPTLSVTDLTVTDTAAIPTLSVTNLTVTDTATVPTLTVTTALTGRYRSVWIPASDILSTAPNNPARTDDGSNLLTEHLDYDDTSDETAHYATVLPDSYDLSTIKVRFYWYAAATTGDVVWSLSYLVSGDGDAVDAAPAGPTTVTATAQGTGGDLDVATTAAITLTGVAAGDLLQLVIARDADNASDTMTGDAKLIGIAIQYNETATLPSSW